MKIAVITITRNDEIRLESWKKYFSVYKDEIYEHIIIDNHSSVKYREKLREVFPSSTIILLDYNGGCTNAYNIGIRHALSNPEIDAIALVGNDIKLERGGFTDLYRFLYSDTSYGMVAPVLLKKDSMVVESFGFNINLKNGHSYQLYHNINIGEIKEEYRIVTCVPGGINMSKPILYSEGGVGLQDENLFMYCDERDMALRCIKKCFSEAVTKKVIAWHQHVNAVGAVRDPRTDYLLARNFVYLARKHFTKKIRILDLSVRLTHRIILFIRDIAKRESRISFQYYIKGLRAGIKGNMDNSFMNE